MAANVETAGSGKPYFKPYEILTRQVTDEQGQVHSLKIGVIGFVTPQITTWDKAALAGKVTTEESSMLPANTSLNCALRVPTSSWRYATAGFPQNRVRGLRKMRRGT